MDDYDRWECRLGMTLADAQRALGTLDYGRLLCWLRDVCEAELDLLPKCPVCEGSGQRLVTDGHGLSSRTCEACGGTGLAGVTT